MTAEQHACLVTPGADASQSEHSEIDHLGGLLAWRVMLLLGVPRLSKGTRGGGAMWARKPGRFLAMEVGRPPLLSELSESQSEVSASSSESLPASYNVGLLKCGSSMPRFIWSLLLQSELA